MHLLHYLLRLLQFLLRLCLLYLNLHLLFLKFHLLFLYLLHYLLRLLQFLIYLCLLYLNLYLLSHLSTFFVFVKFSIAFRVFFLTISDKKNKIKNIKLNNFVLHIKQLKILIQKNLIFCNNLFFEIKNRFSIVFKNHYKDFKKKMKNNFKKTKKSLNFEFD